MSYAMSPAEKQYIMGMIQKNYGARANMGNAMDMAGTALGFVDDAVSPAAPNTCLLYTSPSPRDRTRSRMPSSA